MDTEFTDLQHPKLLSIGLIALDGREHYVELDITTYIGRARRKGSSDFVRYGGVLGQWGLVPGATGTEWEMGHRTARWFLQLTEQSGARVEVAFGFWADFALLEHAFRTAGQLDRVHAVVTPVNVGALTSSPVGEIAAEECFREFSSRRGLSRHHALADANALRAAYLAAKAFAMQMASKRGSAWRGGQHRWWRCAKRQRLWLSQSALGSGH